MPVAYEPQEKVVSPMFPEKYFETTNTYPGPKWFSEKFQEPVRLEVTKSKVWVIFEGVEDSDGCSVSQLVSIHKTEQGAGIALKKLSDIHRELEISRRIKKIERDIQNWVWTLVYHADGRLEKNPIDQRPIFSPYWVEEWELSE